jgi:hypothetical protein
VIRLAAICCLGLCAACAKAPEPRADPAKVELLMARLDAAPSLPAPIGEKVEKADRIAGTVSRLEPKRIDPEVIAAFVPR